MNLRGWNNCKRCGLHRYRRKVVIGEGSIPAQVLFIGEAPGKTEDLRGRPFVGVSGRFLRTTLLRAQEVSQHGKLPTYYITNVVACRPTDKKGGTNRQPTGEEAWACWPRLEGIHAALKPKVVAFLGKVPERFCREAFSAGVPLQHPAFLLRSGGVRAPGYGMFVRQLAEIMDACAEARAVTVFG